MRFSREVDRQHCRAIAIPVLIAILRHLRRGEERTQVRLDSEARGHRIERGIGLDLGRVEVEFLAPDQTGGEALLDDRLEEAVEDLQAVALPDAGQAGVVGQRLVRS